MNINNLRLGYNIFGNKGNVWSNQCHIAASGLSGTTLCEVPMLSTNWARIEEVDHIGCEECKTQYIQRIEAIGVESSHGTLIVDADSGKVLECNGEGYITKIDRLDIEEYQAHYGIIPDYEDILCFGFWYKNGDYNLPDYEFRKNITNLIN